MDHSSGQQNARPSFVGQRLRGRSFRGEDLTGADFSRADLRGANFAYANLTGANFSAAKAGLTNLHQAGLMGLTVGVTIAAGSGIYLLSYLLRFLLQPEIQRATYGIPIAGFTGLLIFFALLAMRVPLKTLNKGVMSLLVLLVVLISFILGGYPVWGNAIALVGLMLAIVLAGTQLIAILIAIAELLYGAIASSALGALLGLWVWLAAQQTQTPAWAGLVAVGLGVTLGWRSVQSEEESSANLSGNSGTARAIAPQFLHPALYEPIWQMAVALTCTGGTSFRHANLSHANFAQARLKQTDFRSALLHRTQFQAARSLSQARRDGSILQQPAVCRLLVTGKGQGQSFVEANLQGANLAGADLRDTNLQDANLRDASFHQANLEQANLSRVHAIGTDFSQALLTGACLAHWNIDASTQLRDVDCRYCYQANSSGQTDRLPAQGEWSVGEFSQHFAGGDRDPGSLFDRLKVTPASTGDIPSTANITPARANATDSNLTSSNIASSNISTQAALMQEVLASLMVLVRLAIADHHLETSEIQLLTEALNALDLSEKITLEQLLDDRTPLETLLTKINSPIIREKVYQSAYLMARIDGELEPAELDLIDRIQRHLGLTQGKVEKLQTVIDQSLMTQALGKQTLGEKTLGEKTLGDQALESQALERSDVSHGANSSSDRLDAENPLSIAAQFQAITDPDKRDAAVDNNIRFMCLMHAFSGAMPIPGFAIVTHLMIYKDQIELVQKIARIWGYPQDYRSPALDQVLFGSVGATAARVAISNLVLLIPGWGSVIGASSAFSMTWAIGELASQFFASGASLEADALTQQLTIAKQRGLQVFETSQDLIQQKQQAIATLLADLQQQLIDRQLSQQDFLIQFKQLFSDREFTDRAEEGKIDS
jgi:uncharacterized protein YjbI with pentapeptide repeats/uncharacterized protein (DUF697 family)